MKLPTILLVLLLGLQWATASEPAKSADNPQAAKSEETAKPKAEATKPKAPESKAEPQKVEPAAKSKTPELKAKKANPVTPAAKPKAKAPQTPPAKVSKVNLSIHARLGSDTIELVGPDTSQQMVVMLEEKGARFPLRDVTREVTYSLEPADVVAVSKSGLIVPQKNGEAIITAHLGKEGMVSIPVKVREFETPQPVSFANDVVPVFTRNHCNAGACHAKATGQNGFQLSLLGFDPLHDYEYLVKKARGRRVFPAAPESSLVLRKASGDLPHQGGARLEKDSLDYKIIRRWIESGMPFPKESDAVVEKIEVFPKTVVAESRGRQQLTITAFLSDGTTRDITRAAQYESNQPEMAEASASGLVTLNDVSGSTSVLVRFQEHIDVFMATIPVGQPIAKLPKARNFIDEHIAARYSVLGLPPSELCDDSTFLRRVTLDIAGRLPTIEETEAFLASEDPKKRSVRIDELLQTTDYADFFAGKWSGLLRNKVNRGQEWVKRDSYSFHSWIRSSFIANKPFNELVGELIMASGQARENPAVNWYRVVEDPKEQMQDISQVFLGIRMQCAQCHHHPYEQWSQEDYYSFAAFFSTLERKETRKLPSENVVYHNRKPAKMQNPATEENMKPRLLGEDEALDIPAEEDPRVALANWIGSEENPYFARSVANRYWKHFFGRGLVEPEDDIRPTNPPTHPELFEDLASHFAESGFDIKELIRVICNSGTYQRSALPNQVNGDDEQNYARYYPKRLPAEVLLDSVNDMTGAENSFSEMPQGVRAISLPNEKANEQSEFLTLFGRPAMDTACECERTGDANLGQSLHLINSDSIQSKLGLNDGRAALLAKDAARSETERIRELYLQAFSREPTEKEMGMAISHLEGKRALSAKDPKVLSAQDAERQAFEDIIWVLVNSKEFLFNH